MAIKKFKDVREMFEKVKAQHQENNVSSKKDFSILDSKIWKPTMDKSKDKTEYKIRFLPNPDSETGMPFVLRKLHGFGPDNHRFYEHCPKSIGKKCPICDVVNPLFKSDNPMDKSIAMSRYGKKRFVANILIEDDPREEGALNGKVFMMEFGVKIKEKLDKAMSSDFLYYSPFEGATFDLEVKLVSDYPNYDGSEFSRKSTKLFDGDEEKLDELASQCYDLEKEILTEDKFRNYEELRQRYEAWENGDQMPKNVSGGSSDENPKDKDKDKDKETLDLIGEIEKAADEVKKENPFGDDVPAKDVTPPKEKETDGKEEEKKDDDEEFDANAFNKEIDKEFGDENDK